MVPLHTLNWNDFKVAKTVFNAGLSSLGVLGVPWHTQILADQLTLSQPGGGADYAHQIILAFLRPWKCEVAYLLRLFRASVRLQNPYIAEQKLCTYVVRNRVSPDLVLYLLNLKVILLYILFTDVRSEMMHLHIIIYIAQCLWDLVYVNFLSW